MADELTERIIGAAIEVHRVLGPGLLEAIYLDALCIELESRGKLTPLGLQPERLSTRRNGGETNENADFDWAARQVTLARDGSRHEIRDGAPLLFGFLSARIALGNASGLPFWRGRRELRCICSRLGKALASHGRDHAAIPFHDHRLVGVHALR